MSQFQSSPLQQILAAMQANPQIAQLAQNVNPQTLQGIGLLQQYAQQNQQPQAAPVPQPQSPAATIRQALMYSNLQNQQQQQAAPQSISGGVSGLQDYLNTLEQPSAPGPLSQDQAEEARRTQFRSPSVRVEAARRVPSVRGNRPSDHGRGGVIGPAVSDALAASPEGRAVAAAQRASDEGTYNTGTQPESAVGSEATYAGPRFLYNPATGTWDQPQTPSNANLAGMLGINPEQLQPPQNLAGMLAPQTYDLTTPEGEAAFNARNAEMEQRYLATHPGPVQPYTMQIQRGTGPAAQTENWEFQHGEAPVTTPASGITPVLDSLKGRIDTKDLDYLKAYSNQPGVTPQNVNEAVHQTLMRKTQEEKGSKTSDNALMLDYFTSPDYGKVPFEDWKAKQRGGSTPTPPSSMAAPSVNQQQANATPYQPGMKFQQGQLVQVGDRVHRVTGFDFLGGPLFSQDLVAQG